VTQANGVLTRTMHAYLAMMEAVRARGADEAVRQQLARFADLAEKDLAITLEVADELGVPLPAAALCRMLMARVYDLE
jgi:3-hydroxyisobutyrate dehydrogenase-like beta-hydroxyacid dehydrogenase